MCEVMNNYKFIKAGFDCIYGIKYKKMKERYTQILYVMWESQVIDNGQLHYLEPCLEH